MIRLDDPDNPYGTKYDPKFKGNNGNEGHTSVSRNDPGLGIGKKFNLALDDCRNSLDSTMIMTERSTTTSLSPRKSTFGINFDQ